MKWSLKGKTNSEIYQMIRQEKIEETFPAFRVNDAENHSVKLQANKSMAPATFRILSHAPFVCEAHPDTIRALKSDIFVMGDNLDEFYEIVSCRSCSKELDIQFWKYCPYCLVELID